MNMLTAGERLAPKTKSNGKPQLAKPKEKPKSERERLVDKGFALATDIREGRGDVKLEVRSLTDDKGKVLGQTKGDRRAYLSKYLKRGEIDDNQCRAGERYAADYEHAQIGVPSALDPARMEATSGGGSRGLPPVSGDAFAELMARHATIAIGRDRAELVIWVAVDGRPAGGWAEARGKPARDGVACLRWALDGLVRHYRLGK